MYFAATLASHVPILVRDVHLLARAGGGGSDSGGGGGGGFILLIGYAPMHVLGARLRRMKLAAEHVAVFDMLQVIGWTVAVVYAAVLVFTLHGLGLIAGAGAIMGIGAGLYGWFGKLRQSKKTKAALTAAQEQDGAWDEAALTTYAQNVFMRYQQDWSTFNTEAMKAYMTPTYQYHASLMMYALKLAARQDNVQNAAISKALITDVSDAVHNSDDQFTIGITATANDVLVDTRDNTQLFVDNKPFTEFWRFRRNGNTWLLDGIQQATASAWVYNASLEKFAADNGYFYSLDWGWLLLPRRGQLFGSGKFGVSDINNHVIGVHNQCLVQLYTYSEKPSGGDKYLIAQTNVPKTYGDIVVRHKKTLHLFGIRGLNNISTEWPDFNKKFEVYASNAEQATSFELLNPTFMEKLEALPFEVNIEVVDNVVYLYAPQKDKTTTADRYVTMLQILNEAFKEMRL